MRINRAVHGHRRRRVSGLVAVAGAVVLGASGCATSHLEEFNSVEMGNATPEILPTETDPAGQVTDLESPVVAAVSLDDGGVALQLDDPGRVEFGHISGGEFVSDERVELPDDSLPVVPSSDGVLVGGAEGIGRATVDGGYEPIGDTGPVTAVAELEDGRILTGHKDGTVAVRSADGGENARLESLEGIDQLAASGNVGFAVSRADTTVANVYPDSNEIGPVLRPGKAAGVAATTEDGWAAVSDTTGNALMIFDADPLRLHQMFPVGKAPWAVAAVPGTSVVWVALSGENRVVAIDISSGQGREVAAFDTVSAPHSLSVAEDGALVVGSADGSGVQIISPEEQRLP
ncbi:YncE family protein [Dietzia timorensis]|uniref:Uncharacterized protein n=1 Tax=Dietzia timorensis TaxID=499555 RepID=A0A173LJD0_9ACTN|nr:hypothetical protein [Dietzia timorensis]ANI92426.1 Hypothetical protein BJL86_1649 [Dietzia timorensis]